MAVVVLWKNGPKLYVAGDGVQEYRVALQFQDNSTGGGFDVPFANCFIAGLSSVGNAPDDGRILETGSGNGYVQRNASGQLTLLRTDTTVGSTFHLTIQNAP